MYDSRCMSMVCREVRRRHKLRPIGCHICVYIESGQQKQLNPKNNSTNTQFTYVEMNIVKEIPKIKFNSFISCSINNVKDDQFYVCYF